MTAEGPPQVRCFLADSTTAVILAVKKTIPVRTMELCFSTVPSVGMVAGRLYVCFLLKT